MSETWTTQRQLETCRLLSASYGASGGTAALAVVAEIHGQAAVGTLIPWSGAFPSAIRVDAGGVIYVYIAGLYFVQQTAGVVASHFSFMVTTPDGDVNPLYLDAAKRLLDGLLLKGWSGASRFVICGHSYGGAVATVLGRLVAGRTYRRVNVFTAGAPMPGSEDWCYRFGHQLDVFRLMGWDDPVPLLPKAMSSLEEGALAPVTFLWKTQAVRYGHPGRGMILLADGGEEAGGLPFQSDGIANRAVRAALGASGGYFGQGHLIDTYAGRLQRRVDRMLSPVARSLVVDSFQDRSARVQDLSAFTRGPNMAASLPRTSVFIPIPFRARMVVSGNVFQVQWMGYVVSTYFTRSPARTLAKRLNSFLRLLQRADLVNPGNIGYAITNYLQEAASGSGGFRPVMQTGAT